MNLMLKILALAGMLFLFVCAVTGAHRIIENASFFGTAGKLRRGWRRGAVTIQWLNSKTVRIAGLVGAATIVIVGTVVMVNGTTTNSPQVIAQWDMVPYTTVGTTTNFGMAGFHISGASHTIEMNLEKVVFTVDSDTPITVTSMALNTQTAGPQTTGVVEYFVPVDPTGRTPGIHTVHCDAYPRLGTVYHLPDMPFVVPSASGDQYAIPYAAVDNASGNDGAGVVSETWTVAANTPFATFGAAAQGIQDYRNAHYSQNNWDGGVVRLKDGQNHIWKWGNTPPTTSARWGTIEPYPGHDRSDTTIYLQTASGNTLCQQDWLHLKNVAVTYVDGSAIVWNSSFYAASSHLWYDGTHQSGGWCLQGNGGNWGIIHWTGNDIDGLSQDPTIGSLGMTTGLIRSNYIHGCTQVDFCRNSKQVFYNTVTGLSGTYETNHSDGYQMAGFGMGAGRNDNVVFYGNTVDSNYQLLWLQQDSGETPSVGTGAKGVAFVRNTLSGTRYDDGSPTPSGCSRFVDHFLWWGNDWQTYFFFGHEQDGGPSTVDPVITNFSVVGNHFLRLDVQYTSGVDFTQFDDNHFAIIAGDAGATGSTSGLIGTRAVHGP